ncbi:ATP-binding protein [Haliscomenobacter sp.]|uniref:sensor histidine kinase n=1 Tax=Haliscomenobacter sp. TaxID=2717303 RepID=UPI003593182C
MKNSTQPETTVDESARMLKLYQLLATSLADNEIFLFDQDFKIIMTEGSPRFVRLQAEENFVGKNLHELIESGKFSFLKDPVTTLFQNNSRYDSEHEIEGSFYTTAIYAAEHEPAEDKKFIGVLLIKDITALTRKQRELELLNKRIDRSNQELENFAYVASHDLHAPLRKIQSFGKLLSDRYAEALTGQGQVYLERILDSTKRMERLLDDLLSFSRSTRSDGGMVPTDLGQVLQDVLTDNNLLDQPEITLNIPTELPVIRAVPSQMQQLFQNLLDNACKFKHPDVPTVIDVRYRRATTAELPELELWTEAEYCVLEFADNGIGFDQENAERIFNIFQRLHGVSEYQGSGIGLAICKKVVDNHRGVIKATGVPGAGAIFTIVLPFE